MEVRVLGPIEVHDRHQLAVGGPRQRRILAALAMRKDEVVSTDRLIDITWPEQPPDQPGVNLKTYVYRLRSGFGKELADRIVTHPPGYLIHLEEGELDAERFEQLVEQADRVAAQGDAYSAVAYADEALSLWRGRPYQEFCDEGWLTTEVARLDEIRFRAQERRAESLIELDRANEAVVELEAIIDAEPFRERPRRLLMLGLYRAGRQAEALRAFQAFRSVLVDEVGIEPSDDLVQFEQQILQQDAILGSSDRGRLVRSYELDRVIGEGAFAMVWQGRQRVLDRDVAVKQIRARLANDPGFIRRFEVEAQLISSLEHPHIVPLYDFWREPDAAFLVMRLLRGGTLDERLSERPLDEVELTRLVEQIGSAMGLAHRRGVIHRDIRPANIMLDEEGNYYLADFGIAFGAEGEDDAAAALSTGSPPYASPEQLRGDSLDTRADIYAFGVTLFAAAIGEAPFADETSRAGILRRQLEDVLPAPSRRAAGVPSWLDTVVARSTTKVVADRYATVTELMADATAVHTRPDALPTDLDVVSARNPFKGLNPFTESEAEDFRGRRRLVRQFLRVLEQPGTQGRFLAAVGPSGSGKSSAVRAGLVPALRRGVVDGSQHWFFTTMMPGAHPFDELESALSRIAAAPAGPLAERMQSNERGVSRAVKSVLPAETSELVLVIDQFEELYTHVESAATREAFLDGLLFAMSEPRSRLRVVVTIRADFWDRPLAHRGLAQLLETAAVTVGPLEADELEQAIVYPVTEQGLEYDGGLVARIIADVVDQPGALPFLQYALTELFDASVSGVIRAEDYSAMGGLTGVLAHRAEEIYSGLDEPQRLSSRRLFGRLVTVGEGSDDTRRRVRRAELGDDADIEVALDAFGAARLLSFDRDEATREPTVEIAHEALLAAWPRLGGWIDEDRDRLRVLRHLTSAAGEWERTGRDNDELYRGARLDGAVELAADRPDLLNPLESTFVGASSTAAERHAVRARRRVRVLQTLLGIAAVLLVIALTTGLIARDQRNDARRAKVDAEISRMTSAAPSVVDTDRRLGLLLAAEAYAQRPGPDTLGGLQRAMIRTGPVVGYLGQADRQYLATRWAGPDTVVAVHTAGVEVYSVESATLSMSLDVDVLAAQMQRPFTGGGVVAFGVSGDQRLVAVASTSATVEVLDLVTGQAQTLVHDDPVSSLAFSHDSARLATGDATGVVRIWDLGAGTTIRQIMTHPEGLWDFDEELIEAGMPGWLLDTQRAFLPEQEVTLDRGVAAMLYAPDGTLVTAETPMIRRWDLDRGEMPDEFLMLSNPTKAGFFDPPHGPTVGWGDVDSMRLDPTDPTMLMVAGFQGLFRYDLSTGALVQTVPIPTERSDFFDGLVGSDVQDDGTWIVALSDGRIRSLGRDGEPTRDIHSQLAFPGEISVDPFGASIAAAGLGGIAIGALDGRELLAEGIPLVAGTEKVSITAGGALVAQSARAAGGTTFHRRSTGGYESLAPGAEIADRPTGVFATLDGEFYYTTFNNDLSDPTKFGLIVHDGATEQVQFTTKTGIGTQSQDGRWYAAPLGSGVSAPGADLAVGVWDLRSGVLVAELGPIPLERPSSTLRSVSFSVNASRIIATTSEGTYRMWETAQWEPEPVPVQLGDALVATFSPDGRFLAVADKTGLVAVRDAENYDLVRTIEGAGAPKALGLMSWSGDGEHLLTHFETFPRLWDVSDAVQIGDPFPNQFGITIGAAAGSPITLVSAGNEDLRVWNLDVDAWFDLACSAVGRNMTQAEWGAFGRADEAYRATCPQFPVGT